MRNIALYLTYLGTAYHGWQVQKDLPTVAETMEKAAAMVVGDRNRVDSYIRSQFQLAGVSHILVVSGLHLSLVAAAVTAVCRKLFRRGWCVALCTALGVFGYMLLVGMTVSVIRAGVLVLLALAAMKSIPTSASTSTEASVSLR